MNQPQKHGQASAIIAECMRRKDAGEIVRPEKVLADHPESADELREYFDAERRLGIALGSPDSRNQPLAKRATVGPGVGDSCPASGVSFEELPFEFGRYRVQKVLGQGAMGAVYLAHDTTLARNVALKTPKLDVFADDELVERFEREARAAATLHHRNICPVHDVGEIDGIRFLTMAYIEGQPLSTYVSEDKPMSRRQAAIIVRKLALGLQEAHDHGVVHRDLKPANVMIDKAKEPVVMDFGLAHQTENTDQSRLTDVGVLMGSPAYMSPEQVRAEPDGVGHASDIYSLGVILFELLTGRLPFEGSVAAIIGQILTADPPHIRTLRSAIDEHLAQICAKMMAKSPQDRFASMKDAADALGDYLRDIRKNAAAEGDEPSIIASNFTVDDAAINAVSVSVPALKFRTSRKEIKRSTNELAKWIGGGLLGLALLAGVIIKFKDGTTVEISDGQTASIETNENGSLKRVAVTQATENPQVAQPAMTEADAETAERTAIAAASESLPIGQWVSLLETEEQLQDWRMLNGTPTVVNGTVSLEAGEKPGHRLYGKRLIRPIATNSMRFIFHVRHKKVHGFAMGEGLEFSGTSLSVTNFIDAFELWMGRGDMKRVATHTSRQGTGNFVDCDYVVIDNEYHAYLNGKKMYTRRAPEQALIAVTLSVRQASAQWREVAIMNLSDAQTEAIRRGELPRYSVEHAVVSPKNIGDSGPTITVNGKIVNSGFTGMAVQTGGDARQLAVSPNGSDVVTTGADSPGRFTRWNTETGDQLSQFDDPQRPGHPTNDLSYSPDGTSLLYCTGNEVRVVSSTDGAQQATFDFPAPPTLVVFPKRTLALATYYEREAHRTELKDVPQRLRIWDWKTKKVLHDDPTPCQLVRFPAISPDERYVTVDQQHNHIRYTLEIDGDDAVLNTPTDFEQTSRVRGPLVFSPDGRFAATSVKNNEHMAAILNVQTGRVVTRLDPATAMTANEGHQYGCNLRFSPDGTQIVMADHTGRAALWEVATGKRIAELDQFQKEGNHTAPGVAVSRNGVAILGGGPADRRMTVRRLIGLDTEENQP